MILAQAGSAALLCALALAGFAAGLAIWAGRRRDAILAVVARRSFWAAGAGVVLASIALEAALLSHQFQIAFVTEHTDRSLPWPLLAAAFYGGQEGSMLYWTLVLTVLGGASLAAAQRAGVRLQAYATAVLALLAAFFLVVLVFVASPFDLLELTPPDGLGLNPVLRDGGMLIHPPFLLAGFASFAIPFAFAMASLLAGRSDAAWLALTRRVALVAWGLQSVGLVLGMWWAYHVLGWGGYWGWDPVENLALLPWLAATAFIHSAQVQERTGQLRAWNHVLVMLAFLLSIFGTFVVRSGIVQSVHSFAVSPIGPWFFGLLVACVAATGATLAARSASLRPERRLEPAANREGAFLLQNLLLAALLGAVLWGTVMPLVTGLLGGQRVVGASYYERVSTPLFAAILALLAAGPLLPWRRAGRRTLRALAWPAGAGLAAAAALLGAGVRNPAGVAVLALLAAAAATALREYGLAVRSPRRLARHRRRYAAYLAHLGFLVLAAGITGSHLWQQRQDVTLAPGQSVEVGSQRLTYLGTDVSEQPGYQATVARLQLGDEILEPAQHLYSGQGGQAVTRVAIRSTAFQDLYVVLAGTDSGSASITIFRNPLVTWIWVGAAILVLAVLFGNLGTAPPQLRPARVARQVPAPAR